MERNKAIERKRLGVSMCATTTCNNKEPIQLDETINNRSIRLKEKRRKIANEIIAERSTLKSLCGAKTSIQ